MIALVKLLLIKVFDYFKLMIFNLLWIGAISISDVNEYLKAIGFASSAGFSIWWWYHKWKQSKEKEQEDEL